MLGEGYFYKVTFGAHTCSCVKWVLLLLCKISKMYYLG